MAKKAKKPVGQSFAYDDSYNNPKYPSLYKDWSSPVTDFDEFAIYNHHGDFTYGEFEIHRKDDNLRRTQVATPPPAAKFIMNSVEDLMHQIISQLENHGLENYDHPLGHPDVNLCDPFAGTGQFVDWALRRYMTKQQVIDKWTSGYISCYEIDPITAMVCASNMELAYATITGEFRRCPFVLCVDTFQVDPKTGVYKCQEDNVEYTEEEVWYWFHV